MRGRLLWVLAAFLVVRALTVWAYQKNATLYYYGQISGQFAIADAWWQGHEFSEDRVLSAAACRTAESEGRFVPLEEWETLPRSGEYKTFPAVDLPGYGYIIAWTSRLFGDRLTARYAMVGQVLAEAAGVAAFTVAVMLLAGGGIGMWSGLLYSLAFPVIWAQASLPMRDIFAVPIMALVLLALAIFRSKVARERIWIPAALLIAALLLWVRPSAYFVFIFVAPLVLLTPGRTWRERLACAALFVAIPLLVFGLPQKRFNAKYYGTTNTHFLGRSLWEGLGIVKDNQYGLRLDDEALTPWLESRGHRVEYASVEMNRLLGEYVGEVLRKDPMLFVRALGLRLVAFAERPLDFTPPRPFPRPGEAAASPSRAALRDPVGFFYAVCSRTAPLLGWTGMAAAVAWLMLRREDWWAILSLQTPFLYAVGSVMPLNYEPRYGAAGAWSLLAALAWCAWAAWTRMRGKPAEESER